MWMLAALSFATSRRLFEIGILVAGVGSGCIGLGAVGMILRRPVAPVGPVSASPGAPAAEPALPRSPARAGAVFVSPALIAASVLLVAGFILMIISVHSGVEPWSPRK